MELSQTELNKHLNAAFYSDCYRTRTRKIQTVWESRGCWRLISRACGPCSFMVQPTLLLSSTKWHGETSAVRLHYFCVCRFFFLPLWLLVHILTETKSPHSGTVDAIFNNILLLDPDILREMAFRISKMPMLILNTHIFSK